MKFTRRELGSLAAVGLASRFAPRALAQEPDRKLRFCAVGLGRISDIFMQATRLSKQARMVALVSGHREKAEKFAADYEIPAQNIYSYDNFDTIAKNPDIDAVYIGLPNSMHAEYTIRAAKAGKHVLCEKPMANTPADCQAMIDACKQAGKKLMIAYRIRYEPFINMKVAEMIAAGKLGKVQTIDAASGFNMNPRPVVKKGVSTSEWRLDGKLAGGGPMMDMGIYALNGVRMMAGEEPVEVKGSMSVIDQDGRFKDVEENLTWTMKFPSGIVATCTTSYGANTGTMIRIVGTKGMVQIEPAWGYSGLKATVTIPNEPQLEPYTEQHPAQFVREADHFADCVFNNKEPRTPGQEGLRDMKLITEIYQSCGRKA